MLSWPFGDDEGSGMANWQRRLVGLRLPCLLTWMLDVGLTLHGQPPEYWAGDYARTTEGAAFYRRLYALHPAAAVGGHLVWVGLVASLLVLMPEILAVVLAIAAVFGHTFGASTWITATLLYRSSFGQPTVVSWYQASNGLFLLSAVMIGVGVHWTVRSTALHRPSGSSGMTGWSRWVLIAVLLTAAAAIVFVPW
jgi:hypothetical protein